jgi:hypothetical protein
MLDYTFALNQLQDESSRRMDAQKRIQLYEGNQIPYIEERLEEHFSDITKFSPTSLNVVKKIINAKSAVYIKDAKRTCSSEKDTKLYKQIQEQSALGLRMRQANRLSKLTGVVLLKVVWRNGKIDLDVITPDICSVETGKSPRDLKSVTITHYPADERVSELTHVRWTPAKIERLDYNGNVKSQESNPYGFLPFVPVWSDLPIYDFWVEPGDSLVSTQLAINEKLTDLIYILRLQGFSLPVLKGTKNELIEFSPGQAISLPDSQYADFSFESPNSPIKAVVDSIDYLIRELAVTEGLPASYLSSKPSERKSGYALLVQNKELQEIRDNDIDLFKIYEKELFETIKAVWNYHNVSNRFGDSTLKVNFFDPTQVQAEEKADFWSKMIEMGAMSPVDIIMRLDPDLSEEQAKQKFNQNKLVNSDVKGDE